MRLYTVCINNLPTVTMSAGVEPAMEDYYLNDPEILAAMRHTQALEDRLKAKGPDAVRMSELHEIDDALDTWLGEDLAVLETDGRPLWSGDRSALEIREAKADEAERWQAKSRAAVATGDADAGDESFLIWLVPVSDPTDEEEGEVKPR
jgi:hypothetical protein